MLAVFFKLGDFLMLAAFAAGFFEFLSAFFTAYLAFGILI